jgi:tetratricopeptide (TPR) repeat protein
MQGDTTVAYALYFESLMIRRSIGDKLGIAISLNNLGKLTSDQGDYDTAYTLLAQSLDMYHTLKDQHGIARAQCNLAEVLVRKGEVVKATAFYRASLATCWNLNARPDIAVCFEGLARLAVAQDHLERAAHLLGAAATLRETIGMSLSSVDVDAHRHHLTIVRTRLNGETFEWAWTRGKTMTMEQAVEYILIKQ